jgi:putative ABC transport system ATP-binding protein
VTVPTGAAVEVREVSKTFRTGATQIVAVDEVSVDFVPGSITAITGPSGSGKSTLLHLVGAIEKADSGRITVDSCELTLLRRRQLDSYRRTVGFVFQRYHLLPTLTALDNVLAPVLPYRVGFNKTARARELLDAVGLGGREAAMPGQLSGGEQQRVAIARALIGRPRLVLADEPSGNLDSRTGEQIVDLLVDVRAEHGVTILIATHEQHIAARCDRLIRLRDGQIIDDVELTQGEQPDATFDRIGRLRL